MFLEISLSFFPIRFVIAVSEAS